MAGGTKIAGQFHSRGKCAIYIKVPIHFDNGDNIFQSTVILGCETQSANVVRGRWHISHKINHKQKLLRSIHSMVLCVSFQQSFFGSSLAFVPYMLV